MKKSIKILLCGVGLLGLIILSIVTGIQIERNHQEALEIRKEKVSIIAIVNMDNGVVIDNQQINYASQLMNFPDEHFIVTGLTDAKAGIENGSYAAYVVIPETFSASVTSIEREPMKVILGYQYNPRLDEEVEVQVINDVNAFVTLLNSNIAYMYVDAILEEFHRVQDDSNKILANDNRELELLENVDFTQLIAVAEPIDEETVDFEIEPVEIESYIIQNESSLESFMTSYSEASQKGKEEYAALQEGIEIETAANNFFSTYDTVIQDTSEKQSELLAVGQDNLADAIGLYNQKVEERREEVENVVSDIMQEQLTEDQEMANMQLQKILQSDGQYGSGTLNDLQEQWLSAYDDLKEKADADISKQLNDYKENQMIETLTEMIEKAYKQGYEDALGNAEEVSPDIDDYSEYIDALRQPLTDIKIRWNTLNVTIPSLPLTYLMDETDYEEHSNTIILPECDAEVIESNTNKIMDLFELQAESEEVDEVIQTYFVDALLIENQIQMERLSDAENALSQEILNYEDIIENYDLLTYIEDADLDTYLYEIENNAGDMLLVIEENNQEYMDYSLDMYSATTENMLQLRDSLDVANTQTSSNVETCISDLISSRQLTNSENVDMLGGFTNSLQYTRVESQGNVEVYDHIVSPTVPKREGQDVTYQTGETIKQNNYLKEILITFLCIGIVLSIGEILFSFYRQYKQQQEEYEDIV